MCGADANCTGHYNLPTGSPPRVRSRRYDNLRTGRGDGITSACAEQTSSVTGLKNAGKDHLRVCGADGGRP